MISVFAPGTMVACIFCIIGWGYLAFKNLKDYRFLFGVACTISSIGYIFAFAQYVVIFYVVRSPQADLAMWFLFLRMIMHCTTVLMFCYGYQYTKYRINRIDGYFRK